MGIGYDKHQRPKTKEELTLCISGPLKVAYTIMNHWDGVFRWLESQITNGILEGFNSLIQSAKAKARGYRTHKNFINMAYLILGKLDLRLPT